MEGDHSGHCVFKGVAGYAPVEEQNNTEQGFFRFLMCACAHHIVLIYAGARNWRGNDPGDSTVSLEGSHECQGMFPISRTVFPSTR